MSKADSESDDQKKALAPIHEMWLVRGVILARYLDDMGKDVRAQVNAPEGIEELSYSFRHAKSFVVSNIEEIRCAVAITVISRMFETLAYQPEEGPPFQLKLLGSGEVEVVGNNQRLPAVFFAERIAKAVFCNIEIATKLFNATLVLLYKKTIVLPVFNSEVKEGLVYLTHNGK